MTSPDYKAFTLDLLADFPDFYFDGFDIQELALKHKVLIEVQVTEPCSDNCNCAEMEGTEVDSTGRIVFQDGPITCYRVAQPETP